MKIPSRVKWLGVVIAVASLGSSLPAQDQCGSLLEHGIFENLSETGIATNSSSARAAFCNAFHQYESNKGSLDTAGQYAAIFNGHVTLNSEQVKSMGQWMCSSSASDYSSEKFEQLNRSMISTSAIDAWKSCVSQGQFIAVLTTYDDTDQGTTGVKISFHRAGATGNTNNEDINWITSSANLTCKAGSLNSLINKDTSPSPVAMGSASNTVDCTRAVQSQPFQSGSRMVYVDSSYVTISTSAGDITRRLPAILPMPPPNPIPRGTIVAWYATGGPIPDGWALCDGTGTTPDLRNRFIMGVGTYDQAGKEGGTNDQKVSVVIDRMYLATKDLGNHAMMADGAGGVLNHTTQRPQMDIVASYTQPKTIDTTFDNRPNYIGIMYIMKQ